MAALPQPSTSFPLSSSSTTTTHSGQPDTTNKPTAATIRTVPPSTTTDTNTPLPPSPSLPATARPQPQTQPQPSPALNAVHAQSSTPRSSFSERSPERPPVSLRNHNYTLSGQPSALTSSSRSQRSPSGILSLAAAALDRTQTAIANFSDPVIRHRRSNTALSRLSLIASPFPSPSSESAFSLNSNSTGDKRAVNTPPPVVHRAPSPKLNVEPKLSPSLSSRDPPSQPYTETDPNRPAPIKVPASKTNKMHQTSSRLLRMTEDDRPFTKDFKDLFSTLVVSLLPLTPHRVRLTKVDHTFLSEDAINNLGSLKFSQSNRMPDPKDPSRIVTTTTTTTFSMAKDMARSICQRFVEARFIESADGKYQQIYNMKGAVWQLTPKGITVLDRFCSKNGIQQKQVTELAANHASQLVILERDLQTDKLLNDRGTIEVIFRRFVGTVGRNIKPTANAADSDSLHDYKDGLTGVKMAAERKVNGKTIRDTFTGKAAIDWLMDCSTIVDRRECIEVATLFVDYDLMEPVVQDRAYMSQNQGSTIFQPTKHAIYQITQRGKDLITGTAVRGRASESEGGSTQRGNGVGRDSHTQRLDKILNDPALRLLFRENLRDTHCEENLSFYQDVDEFVRSCKAAIRVAQKNPTATSMDGVREIMAQAYSIYNAFLAPGSPCELNIDHQLRNNLATRMTKAVGQDVAMIETLQEVTNLFEDAQHAVFKLMASDSVPKFLRNQKYENQLRNYEFELNGRMLERSLSRSNRK